VFCLPRHVQPSPLCHSLSRTTLLFLQVPMASFFRRLSFNGRASSYFKAGFSATHPLASLAACRCSSTDWSGQRCSGFHCCFFQHQPLHTLSCHEEAFTVPTRYGTAPAVWVPSSNRCWDVDAIHLIRCCNTPHTLQCFHTFDKVRVDSGPCNFPKHKPAYLVCYVAK